MLYFSQKGILNNMYNSLHDKKKLIPKLVLSIDMQISLTKIYDI